MALDDEDDDEDGDDDDDDDDGQATSMACQAREDGNWMCYTSAFRDKRCLNTESVFKHRIGV